MCRHYNRLYKPYRLYTSQKKTPHRGQRKGNCSGCNSMYLMPSFMDENKYFLSPYYTVRWGCVLVRLVSKNTRKTQEKRSRLAFFTQRIVYYRKNLSQWARVLNFSRVFLAISLALWIPTCWYPKPEEKREKNVRKIKSASETIIV